MKTFLDLSDFTESSQSSPAQDLLVEKDFKNCQCWFSKAASGHMGSES
jgi:hypothetical protein